MSPSYGFAFKLYVFCSDPTVKIESATMRHLHQNFPHYAVIPTQYVSVFMEEKIELNYIIHLRRGQIILFCQSPLQSFSFHSIWRDTFHCAPQGQTTATFLDLSEWWGKKDYKRVFGIFVWWQELAFNPLKMTWDMEKDVSCLKITLNGVKNIWEVRV